MAAPRRRASPVTRATGRGDAFMAVHDSAGAPPGALWERPWPRWAFPANHHGQGRCHDGRLILSRCRTGITMPTSPPDADALAHSAHLQALIREQIAAAGGAIPFSRFM